MRQKGTRSWSPGHITKKLPYDSYEVTNSRGQVFRRSRTFLKPFNKLKQNIEEVQSPIPIADKLSKPTPKHALDNDDCNKFCERNEKGVDDNKPIIQTRR